jgi:hypothetical protein
MRFSIAARIATAIVSCSLLAACGGGGSSPAPVQTLPPVGGGQGPVARSIVRSDAQAILTVGKLLGDDGYSVGGPPLGAMAVARHVLARKRVQAVQCQPGGFSGVGSVSTDQSTDAQGNTTQTYRDYYDANCAQLERVSTLVFPPGPILASSGSITGSTTEYDHSGAVIGYATVQSSWTPTSVTVQTADSSTVGGAVVGRSGVTCTSPSSTSTTQTCGTAAFQTVAGTTTGLTATLTETFTQTGQTSGNVNAQASATTYAGSGLSLVQPSSGTNWGLSGGNVMDTLSGSGSAVFNGSAVASGNYSVSDTTAGVAASGSFTGSGPLTVTLTQSGVTLATITIDVLGNGTITYADNSHETVAGFVIFG